MSGCERIRAHLDDWLDDLLGPANRDRVEAHLRDCGVCEAFFVRHRTLAADLAALGGAANRIAAVPVAPKRRRSSWLGGGLLRIAAGVVLMTTVGLFVARHFGGLFRPPAPLVQGHRTDEGGTTRLESRRFHLKHEADRIAVPIESGNPRIHIVWLYDTPERDVSPGGEEENDDMPV